MMENSKDQKNDEVLLKVEHLCQYFGPTKAVDDVSFEIKKGEAFGLVGESGCGKTTTGRSIIRLYDITSGNIYFKGQRIAAGTLSYKNAIKKEKADLQEELAAIKADGALSAADKDARMKARKQQSREFIAAQQEEIRRAKDDHKNYNRKYMAAAKAEAEAELAAALEKAGSEEEKKAARKVCADKLEELRRENLVTKIQMIFQDPVASLDPRMTVAEIIAEGLTIQKVKDKKTIENEVYQVLEKVGFVREHAGRYPHEFSGGQRQRIGVARAVIMKPEMIIADEPVSALDVSIQAQVINLLNDLRREMGMTVMFIAHDISVVKYFSDRIGVMYFGKMVELADSDEIFRHPLHPYTKSLFSAIPLPDPEYEKQRKRITYVPLRDHDYSEEQPSFREIIPGHFVLCNTAEEQKYLEEIRAKDAEQA